MTAFALPWIEDEDPRDLRRWAIAAMVVVAVHIAAIAAYVYIASPNEIGEDSSPVTVELSPSDDTVDQTEVAPVPDEQQKQIEQPPPDTSQSVVATPEVQPQQQVEPPPTPAIPARTKGGTPHVPPTWFTAVARRLQQFKRYPSEARDRDETGVVLLSFTIDRSGHLLSRQVAHSSGHPALDNEGMALLERAQPFPSFPPGVADAQLDLTMPLAFDLK
jgi:periplasmic protein TonB